MQVNRVSFAIGFAAVLAAAPAFAASHKATSQEPVYKVDSVTATTDEGRLVVTAHGAVRSGGWTSPHLRAKLSKDMHVMTFEFVAVPPPPDAAVIQSLVPVEAKTIAPLPGPRISEIRIDGESNDASIRVPGEDGDAEPSQ